MVASIGILIRGYSTVAGILMVAAMAVYMAHIFVERNEAAQRQQDWREKMDRESVRWNRLTSGKWPEDEK